MYFAITIDTEEDWDWEAGFPVKHFTVDNIARLDRFHELCQRYEVATTYFTNYAVLGDDAAARVIQDFSRTPRTEIGMHLHPWTNPPRCDEDNSTETSFLENLRPETARQKLESVYRLHQHLGFAPTSFRGGRYSTGPVTRRFLFEKQFKVDASVCPYSTWEDAGAPDYRHDGEKPMRFEPPEGLHSPALWSLPLTRVYSRKPFELWNSGFSRIEQSGLSRLRLIGVLDAMRVIRRIWLNFETETAERMVWLVRRSEQLGLPYLCFTVHSSSLSVGTNPYAKTVDQVEQIFDGIEHVFQLLTSLPAHEPATITEIAIALEEQT